MRCQQQKLETEKKKLKETLEMVEQRATKLELNKKSLEGDLERSQLAMNEKEVGFRVIMDEGVLPNKSLF